MENNFPESECRTYENVDALRMQVDNTDSASLHFESILESDIDPDECPTNGFSFNGKCNASARPWSLSANYVNDEIVSDKDELPHRIGQFGATPKNELNDNALFNKFREAADTTAITSYGRATSGGTDVEQPNESNENNDLCESKLKDSNSVSCEDLLEFANEKPKGKDRGIESDEVRIMTKMFGAAVSNLSVKSLLFSTI